MERNSSGGKSGGGARMSMNHSTHVGAHAVDGEMHRNFARGIPVSADLLPLRVNDHHVFGSEHAFAETRGCDHEPVVVHTYGEIAVRGCYKTLHVEQTPELHQVLAKLGFIADRLFEREHWVLPE